VVVGHAGEGGGEVGGSRRCKGGVGGTVGAVGEAGNRILRL